MSGFPADFRWGAATAAYQVEGAVEEGGRGPSIWDEFCRRPGAIARGESGALACDHYHRYRDDIAIMRGMGLDAYRFSIAWSRVLPSGKGRVNPEGLSFYSRLVDALLDAGIRPMATLYHWDLPQALQEEGGWASRDCVARFADYAALVFGELGDRVDLWVTLNEPWVSAYAGHFAGRHAPGMSDFGLATTVSHNLNLAHASAVAAYRAAGSPGKGIGPALNLYPMHPADPASAADVAAALLADGYHNRWFLDPILKGTYPADTLAFFESRGAVPEIRDADLRLLAANSCDFVGVNYYFRKVIKADPSVPVLGFAEVKPEGRPYTSMGWEVYPEGLAELLLRLRDEYGRPRAVVTENGAAFDDEGREGQYVDDEDRRSYLAAHVEAARKSIAEGCRLEGYYAWSLLDNFEWAQGYAKRFGLIRVDYGRQTRIWKKSALWYRDFIAEARR